MNQTGISFIMMSLVYEIPLFAIVGISFFGYIKTKWGLFLLMMSGEGLVLGTSIYSSIITGLLINQSITYEKAMDYQAFRPIGFLIGGLMFAVGLFMLVGNLNSTDEEDGKTML